MTVFPGSQRHDKGLKIMKWVLSQKFQTVKVILMTDAGNGQILRHTFLKVHLYQFKGYGKYFPGTWVTQETVNDLEFL